MTASCLPPVLEFMNRKNLRNGVLPSNPSTSWQSTSFSSFEQTGTTEDASKKDISVQVIPDRGVSGSHKSMTYKWKILIQPAFGTRWMPKLTVSARLT